MIPKKKSIKPYRKGLIGKYAVIEINNIKFEGNIIFETKNTIKIKTNKEEKTILKHNAKITVEDQLINGLEITKKSEERIKSR